MVEWGSIGPCNGSHGRHGGPRGVGAMDTRSVGGYGVCASHSDALREQDARRGAARLPWTRSGRASSLFAIHHRAVRRAVRVRAFPHAPAQYIYIVDYQRNMRKYARSSAPAPVATPTRYCVSRATYLKHIELGALDARTHPRDLGLDACIDLLDLERVHRRLVADAAWVSCGTYPFRGSGRVARLPSSL